MNQYTIIIKNMVCPRCITAVKEAAVQMQWTPLTVDLGRLELAHKPIAEELKKFEATMRLLGFEVLGDRNAELVEKVKRLLLDLIYGEHLEFMTMNISQYLSEKTGKDYSVVSSLFSSSFGITVERYFILQKIERAKELLCYGEVTLKEISYRLGYSSTAHLSNQFRQTTGISPSQFKSNAIKNRTPIDRVGTK